LTPLKKVGGNFFSSNDLQNDLAFAGNSPWPVVDTTNTVKVNDFSNSCSRIVSKVHQMQGNSLNTHSLYRVHFSDMSHEM
jgi:hypothetical protein